MTKLATSTFAAAALVAVVVSTTACGSSASPSASGTNSPDAATGTKTPGATAPDPCSLITDAQAAALFGSAVSHVTADPRDASNGSGVKVTETRCEYDEVTSSQLGYDLWVAVYAGADRAYFDDSNQHQPAITGLGDAAFGDNGEVHVISKGVVLELYGSLPGNNGMQQAAKLAIASL